MDLDIRKAVFNNLNQASHDDVEATINDAISLGEEKILPGLGVLFELLWKNTTPEWKNDAVHQLTTLLK